MRKLIFLTVCLLVSQPAFAKKGFTFTQFQVGGQRTVPKVSISSAFVHMGWTPVYKIKRGGFRGEVGFTGLLRDVDQRYLAMNYQAYAYYVLFSLVAVEAGAGAQTHFHDTGGTYPVVSANLVLYVEGDLIDRLVMGYSRILASNNGMDQFYSGIGFKI